MSDISKTTALHRSLPMSGPFGAADAYNAMMHHADELEKCLGIATAALREIAEAQGDRSLSLEVRGFELIGRMQGIASVALDASTLNPRVDVAADEQTKKEQGT